jgi:hypothetical protein
MIRKKRMLSRRNNSKYADNDNFDDQFKEIYNLKNGIRPISELTIEISYMSSELGFYLLGMILQTFRMTAELSAIHIIQDSPPWLMNVSKYVGTFREVDIRSE